MTSFAIRTPPATATPTPPPVAPPAGGTSPTGGTPPPAATPAPTTPREPLTGISETLVVDLTEASRLVGRAVEMLGTVPRDDAGTDATKDMRIRIFKTSEAAQKRIEQQMTGNPDAVVSELRRADAFLEDANWQLAKKPSPDGRFTGVDIPGAIRDTQEGARVLGELLVAAGGTPVAPPPVGPPSGPSTPPAGPSTPPAGPPTTPTVPPTTPVPGGGTPDSDYPGEDEFPTDDKILQGGDS